MDATPYRLKFLPQALAVDKREDMAAYRAAVQRLLCGHAGSDGG